MHQVQTINGYMIDMEFRIVIKEPFKPVPEPHILKLVKRYPHYEPVMLAKETIDGIQAIEVELQLKEFQEYIKKQIIEEKVWQKKK